MGAVEVRAAVRVVRVEAVAAGLAVRAGPEALAAEVDLEAPEGLAVAVVKAELEELAELAELVVLVEPAAPLAAAAVAVIPPTTAPIP